MFRPLISKLPTQSYIQTINVQNDKYKQYPNKQTIQQQLKGKSKGQRDANTKVILARVIEEETEKLGENLSAALQVVK